MYEQTSRLIEAVEHGTLSRREAVGRLVALAAATFAGAGLELRAGQHAQASGETPTFRSVGLNHVALRVTDLTRSRDFYGRHLGLGVLEESPYNCFMAAGGNHFVAMFRSDKAGLDHFCFTIENYRPDAVVANLDGAGLDPKRREDRVYFDDPDGIELQLASEWGDYPGGRQDAG